MSNIIRYNDTTCFSVAKVRFQKTIWANNFQFWEQHLRRNYSRRSVPNKNMSLLTESCITFFSTQQRTDVDKFWSFWDDHSHTKPSSTIIHSAVMGFIVRIPSSQSWIPQTKLGLAFDLFNLALGGHCISAQIGVYHGIPSDKQINHNKPTSGIIYDWVYHITTHYFSDYIHKLHLVVSHDLPENLPWYPHVFLTHRTTVPRRASVVLAPPWKRLHNLAFSPRANVVSGQVGYLAYLVMSTVCYWSHGHRNSGFSHEKWWIFP